MPCSIFDEVITGFRIDPGGAQAKYDVTPDLTTFGKVIGGGLPIGAIGGRREVMETLTPLGKVFHAGTLAGNPIATAAGLAALGELGADVYMELSARARRLAALLRDACAAAGFAASFPVVGTLVGVVCGDVPRRSTSTAPAAPTSGHTQRCSRRCWPKASPSRPAPMRRSSSASATTTP